jgi:Protein of unknown function (DUF4012)
MAGADEFGVQRPGAPELEAERQRGRGSPPPGRRRPSWPPRRSLAVVGLVLVAWAAFAGWSLLRASIDLRAGKRAIDAARAKASAAELIEARPAAHLREAERRLRAAHRRLGSPALAPVRLLPVVGRQLRSLSALSRAAATVADAGARGVTRARSIVARTAGPGADEAAVARDLADVAADTLDRVENLDLGPSRGLFGPIARSRAEMEEKLTGVRTGLRRSAAGGRALSALLAGPRRYLVLAANNSEMRAGSGMFLQVGELETGDGALHLASVDSVTAYHIPPGSVPLGGDLADRWGWLHPHDDWRQLMLSPRFDVQAPLAARMWEAAGRPPVDGVLLLDPVAFAGILRATGPVEVAGRKVGANQVVRELLHDQYVRYSDEGTDRRREGLGELARAAFAALESGGWSLADLARGLLPVVDGRHVLAWSARPEEQADWVAAGIDGALRPDSVLVALSNRGANKLDYFQRVESELGLEVAGDQTLVSLRVTLRNTVPTGEPRYVAGENENTGAGEGGYLGIFSINVPGAARNVRIDGVDQLAVAGPDGPTQVVGFQLLVPRDETRTIVVRFQLPGPAGTLRIEPSARVPAIQWTAGEQTWTDTSPHLLTWEATE